MPLDSTLPLRTPAARDWPVAVRYALSTLIVIIATALQLWLWPAISGHPFLLFYPAIVLSAFLFDWGNGIYVAFLSSLSAAFFFLEPRYSLRVEHDQDRLALIGLILTGVPIAVIIESMHRALHRLSTANRALAQSDQEKDLIVQETLHRVRNDLSIATSLLNLQERTLQEPAARSALSATAERIRLIGRVQQRLRRDGSETSIEMAGFIKELCNDLQVSILSARPIRCTVSAREQLLPHSQAVSIGLIINELLTNCVKYAFPDDRAGNIQVRFSCSSEGCCLAIEDDGIGSDVQDLKRETGLGMRLVRAMTAQLGGTLEIKAVQPSGLSFIVRFPRPSSPSR
jgi:two-component sensor histidine kinase